MGMGHGVKGRTQPASHSFLTSSSVRENPDPANVKERHWIGLFRLLLIHWGTQASITSLWVMVSSSVQWVFLPAQHSDPHFLVGEPQNAFGETPQSVLFRWSWLHSSPHSPAPGLANLNYRTSSGMSMWPRLGQRELTLGLWVKRFFFL